MATVLETSDGSGSTLPKLGLAIRSEFPIFNRPSARPLAFLDSAASSQKCRSVIERLTHYLSFEHANIHRGAYALSAEATESYDIAKRKLAAYIGAADEQDLIFTRGTTESINLVAHAFEHNFKVGDVVLLTLLEHHSNIVPWQLLAERKGLKVEFVQIDDHGVLDLGDLERKLRTLRPKLLGITQLANSLGSVVPLEQIIPQAHALGARVLVDAAQSIAHGGLNVAKLDADFVAFSGHKMYGPTGIGGLYVKSEMFDLLKPFMGGGDMIRSVSVNGSTYAEKAQRFEAGTPPIAEAIAFGTAVDFIEELGTHAIIKHEQKLFDYAWQRLSKERGVKLYGPAAGGGKQSSIISFNLEGVHAHDLSTVADQFNVQFRSGHHCAMPTLTRLGLGSTARISFGVYSDTQDVDALCEAIAHARKMFL